MKAKFGAIVVDGRGKIGGHVASKNRSGSYFRTKVTPSNPNTSKQSAVRSQFGALAQAFRGLTVAQVTQWNDAVSSWSKTNIFGDSIKPTGLNLFVQLNMNILLVGGSMLTTPPEPTDMPSDLSGAVNFTVTGTVAELAVAGNPVGTLAVVLKSTPKISNGVNYVKNLFRKINDYSLESAVQFDIKADWVAQWGSFPAVGDRHICSMDVIQVETGQVIRDVPVTFSVVA